MDGFYLAFNVKNLKVIVKHKCHFLGTIIIHCIKIRWIR